MRGTTVIRLVPPQRGLISNLAPHLVPSDALLDGSNVYVDIDGILKTRSGYINMSAAAPASNERVMGLAGFQDINNTNQLIAATTKHWYQFSTTGTWTDITDPLNPNNGSLVNQVRMIPFYSSNKISLVGTNGNDSMKQWDPSLAQYAVISAAPVANDIGILTNRVIAVNTTEAGVKQSRRVRWSSINDQTTWPASAFQDLADSGDAIVGLHRIGRTSALILRNNSVWYMQAQPGDDTTAFSFDVISTGSDFSGPWAPAAIVGAEGRIYWIGQDNRIYAFDSVSVQPISDAIFPVLTASINTPNGNLCHGTYLPAKRQVWFFFPQLGNQDPNMAVVLDLPTGRFETLQSFTEGISASTWARETQTLDWTTWVSSTTDWSAVPWASWFAIPATNATNGYIGTAAGQIARFMSATTDNGIAISYSFTPALLQLNDPRQRMKLDFVEFYFSQALTPESIQAVLYGLLQPLTPTPTAIVGVAIALEDATTYFMKIEPGATNPANQAANFFKLVFSSAGATDQLKFGGGNVFVYTDDRGDYGTQ